MEQNLTREASTINNYYDAEKRAQIGRYASENL